MIFSMPNRWCGFLTKSDDLVWAWPNRTAFAVWFSAVYRSLKIWYK